MSDTFSEETRKAEQAAFHGFCRVKGCLADIHSFHHRLPNTVVNRKKFPLFIQSQFNCAGVCDYHHINHKQFDGLDVSEGLAIAYEKYLETQN